MKAWKIIRLTDEVTDCSCCGRTDLKRTVLLALVGGGEDYFGTDCAARALERTRASVLQGARAAERKRAGW